MDIIRKTTPKRDPFYYPTKSLLDDFFLTPSIWEMPNTNPLSADMWEENGKVHIKMAMPGIKKEDIKITITDDQVSISGNSKQEEEEKDKKRKYYYRSMESSFEQTFNLPTKVDSNKAEAEFKDGVINITLPEEKAIKPKEIEIK